MTRHYFNWLIQIIAVTDYVISVLPMMSSNVVLVTSPKGEKWCSVDQPSAVFQMVSGDMSATCGLECLKDGCCLVYQFKASSSVCELFDYTTTNFIVTPGCTGYRITKRAGQPVPLRTYSPRYIIDGSNGQCNITLRKQFYIVCASNNNKVIDIGGGGGNSGDPLMTNTLQTGKTSQLWYFDARGFFRSVVNDNCFRGGTTTGTIAVTVTPCTSSTDWNQQWTWLPASQWLFKKNENICLAIYAASNANGVGIVINPCNNGWNQMWGLA